MRKLLISVAIVTTLGACSPPAQQTTSEAPSSPAPTIAACNDVHPDASKQVAIEDAQAVAAAAVDLRGGRITPRTYDLTRALRLGQATGWTGTRAVALAVAETADGTTFNWAGAAPNGAVDTWTASFTDTPRAQITFTCGRTGTVEANFNASANALDLRLPDGANGQLHLSFARRS
jgi:hypothetical protein